jgi:hypothetical protein
MQAQPPRIDQIRAQLSHVATPNQAHIHLHLILQQLHGAIDARQAVGTHSEEKGATDTDAAGAQTQGLDDVGGAAHAAVDVDLDAILQAAFAEHGHDLGEHLDGGAGKVELAAAVVGEDDAVDAGVDGAQHVLDALHALEDDGHARDGEEPGEVGPGEGGVDEGGDGAGGALGAVDGAAAGGLHVGARVGEFGAHVFLAAAELGGVDGDEEALAAAVFGVLDDLLGDVAVLVDVELEPLDLAGLGSVDDLVEGARGQGGDHLDDVVFVGAAGQDDFAFGVAEFAQGGGGDVEGHVDFGAEHSGGGVDFFHVDEHAWAEPDLVVGRVVFAHGDLVVGTGGVVGPCCLFHDAAGHRFEIHEVVALLEDGHLLDAFLTALFFGVIFLFLLLNARHVDLSQVLFFWQILFQRVRRVDGFVFLGRIFAGILEDDFGAAGMFWLDSQAMQLQSRLDGKSVPGKNSVTSYAFPCTITQHDSRELCLATSVPLSLVLCCSCSWFMMMYDVLSSTTKGAGSSTKVQNTEGEQKEAEATILVNSKE